MNAIKLLLVSILLLALPAWADVEPLVIPPQGSVTLSVTNSSAATAIAKGGPAGTGMRQVELQNSGTAVVFVEFCSSSTCTAAVATGYPVLVGQSKVVSVNSNTTHVAAIAGTAGPHTFYVTVGQGN
jgi:hypothetical protein